MKLFITNNLQRNHAYNTLFLELIGCLIAVTAVIGCQP